jgi:hypothetical protein
MKFFGLVLLLASMAAGAGFAVSSGSSMAGLEMVKDVHWLVADAGVVAGMLLLLAGNETVLCNKV